MVENPILKIESISKAFGNTQVIKELSFDVASGEFLTILGASGCGKTTLLRIISGLEEADGGRVILDGRDVTKADANKREVNTVFQSYALFPHMNVYDNVAYSLKILHCSKKEIKKRVADALSLVQLSGYEKRYPNELSGGQKQRVAIARAIIGRPKILLLDEPLGALDLNLRRTMQTELKNLQKTLGITFIYITHDQEEALNMSDRIAIMKDGGFIQLDTPSLVYDSPKNIYAAQFVGKANILPCTFVRDCGDYCEAKFCENVLMLRKNSQEFKNGDKLFVSVRGEKIEILTEPSDGILSTVCELNFSLGVMRMTLDANGTKITALRYGLDKSIEVGQSVYLKIPPLAGVVVEE